MFKIAPKLAAYGAIGLAFSLPIAPAPSNLFLFLTLVFTLLSPNLYAGLRTALSHSWVRLAVCLGGLLWLSALWSQGDFSDSAHYLTKYSTLFMVPLLFITFAKNPQLSQQVILSFALSAALTLFCSYAIWLEFGWALKAFPRVDPAYPTVFKLHTTQSIVIGLGLYFWWSLALSSSSSSKKTIWFLLALVYTCLAVINLLYMTHARIGYAALVLPLVVYLLLRFNWKGALLALSVVLSLSVGAYFASNVVQSRVDKTTDEVVNWTPEQFQPTDMGVRLSWWHVASRIVRENPMVGAGVGSYQAEFARHAEALNVPSNNNNPHNQFVLLAAQTGVLGAGLFLLMFLVQFAMARALEEPERLACATMFAIFGFGNLFNSFLLDSAERTMFVLFGAAFAAAMAVHSRVGGN